MTESNATSRARTQHLSPVNKAFGFASAVLAVLAIIGLISFVVHARRDLERMQPPERISLEQYLGLNGKASIWRSDSHAETIVEGPTHSEWTIPSGPCLYVFDANGRLVDWTPDSGDDPEFKATWGWGPEWTKSLRSASPRPATEVKPGAESGSTPPTE